ncbi:hypothetical protein P7C73_g746, partial [Tremellales sp. Uapishka_1]
MSLKLFACGSNGAGQLALSHQEDTSTFQAVHITPSLSPNTRIVDLVSSASHSLLLVNQDDGYRNILLGAGTNSHGQLGEKCLLWEDGERKVHSRFDTLALVGSLGLDYKEAEWEPVQIAATWTTSLVVYSKIRTMSTSSADESERRDIVIATGSNDFGELGSG